MARPLRIEFTGACHHVINRGNYRRHLFGGGGAAEAFERTLGEAARRFGGEVHAYGVTPQRALLVQLNIMADQAALRSDGEQAVVPITPSTLSSRSIQPARRGLRERPAVRNHGRKWRRPARALVEQR